MSKESGNKENGWTETREKYATALSNRYAAYVWMCNKTSDRISRQQQIISVVIAGLMYILGSAEIPTILTSYGVVDSTDSSDTISYGSKTGKIILLIFGVLTIIAGLIKTINVKMKPSDKIGKFRWASAAYAKLSNEIRKTLQKDAGDRDTWINFYDNISTQNIEIQSGAPTIPKNIIKQYYKQMGNEAIVYSALFGDIEALKDFDNITVNTQTPKVPTSREMIRIEKYQTRQKVKSMRILYERDTPEELDDSQEEQESQEEQKSEDSQDSQDSQDSEKSTEIKDSGILRSFRESHKNKEDVKSAKKLYNARNIYELDRYFISSE